jgi:hypothetical protein
MNFDRTRMAHDDVRRTAGCARPEAGFGQPNEVGPNAATTLKALRGFLHAARVRGDAMIDEVFAPIMSCRGTRGQRLALRRRLEFGRSGQSADGRIDSRVLGTAARYRQ